MKIMDVPPPYTDTTERAYSAYLKILADIPLGRKLQAIMEWSELARESFRSGLRHLYPDIPEPEFTQLYLARLKLCHNKNS